VVVRGRACFIGFSPHDRPHIKRIIEKYPNVVDVIRPLHRQDEGRRRRERAVGRDEDGRRLVRHRRLPATRPRAAAMRRIPTARRTPRRAARLRYILCNPQITAPTGLISIEQVDNAAMVVKERRELDVEEKAMLDSAMDGEGPLPFHYRWLKDWEYVRSVREITVGCPP
jgi:hypothetical protein